MLLGFKKRFIEPIKLGTKVFTMRTRRKNMPKIGETLYMYSGLRTASCQKISDQEKLISVQKVAVFIYRITNYLEIKIRVDGRYLSKKEINQFVKYDGFVDEQDFAEYWIKNNKSRKVKPRKDRAQRVGGFLDLYHWTDLRY